jgi:hypothetical protein
MKCFPPLLHINNPSLQTHPYFRKKIRVGQRIYTARDSKIGSADVEQPLHLRPAWLKFRASPWHLPIFESLPVSIFDLVSFHAKWYAFEAQFFIESSISLAQH